jgi:hypothetical protein
LSISITKNMPETDSPISLVVARSLIATKTKMVDECSMNRELDTFGPVRRYSITCHCANLAIYLQLRLTSPIDKELTVFHPQHST